MHTVRQGPADVSNAPRSTTMRDKHRAIIGRQRPPCHICDQPIDYSLPHLDPGEFVVDHVMPLARGGLDVIENKAAAHRSCNRKKSDKVDGDAVKLTPPIDLVTSRTW